MKRNRAGLGGLRLTALLAVALPASAQAHTTLKGMNDFWNGAFHPLLTPAHALLLLGLGLWLGQQVPLRLGWPVRGFLVFAAVGLALTTAGFLPGVPSAVLAALALGVGALVALEKPLPVLARSVVFAAAALAVGLDSGVETGGAVKVAMTLLGTWTALTVGLLNLAFYASMATETRRKWLHIGLRVVGSWIVAITVLILAFSLRK